MTPGTAGELKQSVISHPRLCPKIDDNDYPFDDRDDATDSDYIMDMHDPGE
jgi:hypothetical protein